MRPGEQKEVAGHLQCCNTVVKGNRVHMVLGFFEMTHSLKNSKNSLA